MCSVVLCTLFSLPLQAQESQVADASTSQIAIHMSVKSGNLPGQVFTHVGETKTPLSGKVTLVDAEGNTIATSQADAEGNFMFTDVGPGQYKTIGVSGDYAGEKSVVITADGESIEGEEVPIGNFQVIPLEVGPATPGAIYESYAELPAASFSDVVCEESASCSTCANSTIQSLGGSCGCSGGGGAGGAFGGKLGAGLNYRRLALIGGAVAIPVALSGGADDAATPDQ